MLLFRIISIGHVKNHRLLILECCGHVEFSNAEAFFEEAVEDMVNQQMHPRKLCYLIVEWLRKKKLNYLVMTGLLKQLPRNLMHLKYAAYNVQCYHSGSSGSIRSSHNYNRRVLRAPLLTQLKAITQSMRPKQIVQNHCPEHHHSMELYRADKNNNAIR